MPPKTHETWKVSIIHPIPTSLPVLLPVSVKTVIPAKTGLYMYSSYASRLIRKILSEKKQKSLKLFDIMSP